MADDGSFKRQDYVDRLLTADSPAGSFARRSAENLARVWRRMMVPASSPGRRHGHAVGAVAGAAVLSQHALQ